MLMHISGILDREQLARLRTALDGAAWTDGRETVGAQGARVKRNLQLPDTSPLRLELGREVSEAVARHPLFHAAVLPQRILPPRFNRYEGGGHYGFHVDGAVMALPEGGQLRSDVSCTLFLSEPEEYDGGELIVSDLYGEHEVKLPAGDAIVYPSTSVHEVRPVSRGERLASFLWVQSMVRDDAKRAMLFELDTNIQALRARVGETAEVVGLTGHYHNLLRMWADT
jgi:PKHD-type hydroxylase